MDVLYVLFFLDILNMAVFITVFSPFIKRIGGTPSTLGLINSGCALVSLLWNPIVGSLSDQIGRKGLLIKCLVATTTGSLLLASSNYVAVVFIAKLISSLGSGVGILIKSLVADIYKTPEEKKSFFDKSAFYGSTAFLIGSMASGFLSELDNGFTIIFLSMASITGVAAITTKFTLPDDLKSSKHKGTTNKTSILSKSLLELKKAVLDIQSISWPRYKQLFILKAGFDFAFSLVMSNIGLILVNEFNLKGRYMGYVFIMISITGIITNVLKLKLRAMLETLPDHKIIVAGCSVFLLSFTGMSISSTALTFVFFLNLSIIGKSILESKFTEMITAATTKEDRGKVLGAFENLMHLSGFIVPLVSGYSAEIFGERVLTFSGTIPMSVTLLTAWVMSKNKHE